MSFFEKKTLFVSYLLMGEIRNETIRRSILVVWPECQFLDTEVDGSNPGNSMLFT